MLQDGLYVFAVNEMLDLDAGARCEGEHHEELAGAPERVDVAHACADVVEIHVVGEKDVADAAREAVLRLLADLHEMARGGQFPEFVSFVGKDQGHGHVGTEHLGTPVLARGLDPLVLFPALLELLQAYRAAEGKGGRKGSPVQPEPPDTQPDV